MAEDQSAAIAALSDPALHDGTAPRRADTHISVVVLGPARVFKLKRAVRLPYLDFGTSARRREACEAELRLNRRTAPGLYRAVRPLVPAGNGALRLGEAGATPSDAVDWVVEMRRFADGALFSEMAERGALTPVLVRDLADAVAALHETAEVDHAHGGADGIARVLDEVAECCAPHPDVLDPAKVARLDGESRALLARVGPGLDRRRAQGRVRRGHGDLHLGNICLDEGRPTLFDGIEFSDDLACVDGLYDMAFAVMDLLWHGLPALANLALNRYLDRMGESDGSGLAALPLFLSNRAGIRAHVAATAAAESGKSEKCREAAGYLDLALRLLRHGPACLVAVGGLSGSGKSTVAQALAPSLGAPPGARLLRTDVVRKRRAAVAPETRLPADAYTAEADRAVYLQLMEEAGAALDAGCPVILDAVFAKPAERAEVAALAARHGMPFAGVWLDVPPATMAARIAARTRDASDATPAVLARQLGYDLGTIEWVRLDASGDIEAVTGRARAALRGAGLG